MRPTARRGFTLVELLVVVVLGSLMTLAIYQVLITNSRTYAVNNAQIQGQQSLRAGMDVLFGELREISADEGDIVSMAVDSVTIRTSRAFGLVCATNYGVSPPTVTAFRIGPVVEAGDSIFLFADNMPSFASDDVWLTMGVSAVDTTATCVGGAPAQELSVGTLASTGDTVRMGAPLRAFDTYTYGLSMWEGEPYLSRQISTAGAADPLVGPLLTTGGLTFRYLDSLGAVTTTATDVAQIEVRLRYASQVLSAQNRLVRDSIMGRVYLRN